METLPVPKPTQERLQQQQMVMLVAREKINTIVTTLVEAAGENPAAGWMLSDDCSTVSRVPQGGEQ
jgi:hypothetical protein